MKQRLVLITALLALLLGLHTGAFAYAVSGVVKDTSSGAALPGANVILEGLNLGTTTAGGGEFEFPAVQPGEYVLSVSFIGYKVWKSSIKVRQNVRLDVLLEATSLPGQQVTITAERAVERETPAAFDNLQRQTIDRTHWAQELPMMLSELPNLFSYSDAGNGLGYSYLKIRGFDQKRIGVMVNGIPLNDPEDHEVYWVDMVDLASNTQDIQVQRGVSNSLYGASAFGGSVNVVTSTQLRERGIFASVGGGSYNTRKTSLAMSSGLINNTYEVYGRFSRLLSDGYRDNSGVDSWSYFLSAVKYGKSSTLKLNLYGGPEIAYAAWDAVHEDELKVNHRANPTPGGYKNTIDNFNQPHYELLHSRQISDKVSLDNTLFYIRGKGYYEGLKRNKRLRDFGMSPVATFDPTLFGGDSLDYYATTDIDGSEMLARDELGRYTIKRSNLVRQKWVDKYQVGWIPRLHIKHSGGDLTLGGEFYTFHSNHWGSVLWSKVSPLDSEPNLDYYGYNADRPAAAAYAHELYHLNDKLQLMGDVQLQYKYYHFKSKQVANYIGALRNAYEVTDFFVNPKLGVNYNATERLNVFGSVSMSNREPADSDYWDAWVGPDDLGAHPLFARADTVYNDGAVDYVTWSNPLVDPERVIDYELGFGWRTQRLHIKANAYVMDFRNEIIPYGQVDDDNVPIKGNADKTMHRGIELSLNATLARTLTLNANYAASQNFYQKFTFHTWDENWNTVSLDYSGNAIPLFPGQLLNARLNWAAGPLNVSAALQHVGKQYMDSSENNARVIEPFTVLNASVSYSLKTGAREQARLSLFINNLLDLQYEASGYYDDWAGARFYYPAARRNFYLSLQVNI